MKLLSHKKEFVFWKNPLFLWHSWRNRKTIYENQFYAYENNPSIFGVLRSKHYELPYDKFRKILKRSVPKVTHISV